MSHYFKGMSFWIFQKPTGSSVETVTFDSTSSSIEERKKSIRIELRTGTFNKITPYRLVLRDVESDAEVQSVPVVIDRSFDDDF